VASTLERGNAPASAEPSNREVRAYLELGLRNRWHPVIASALVGDHPVGLLRLGEPIVVWRDAGGAVHVQADFCPHRGVPLSRGINCGDRIRCRYHHVEVGPDGTVLRVPGQPGCSLEGKQLVKVYPALELKGAIFAYFGDALHPEPVAFPKPPELEDDERFEAFLCYAEWKTAWRYLQDNNLDPMHGTFLHAKSHSMFRGAVEMTFRTTETSTGFVFAKESQRDTNFDWSELNTVGSLYVRLEIPYPPSGGPGGNFGIIAYATPIDAEHSACFFWRWRKVQGWQRDVWRFLYKNRLEARHFAVLEQDRAMLDGCAPGLERHEHLYAHDGGVVALRRFLMQEARAQLIALREGGHG
jgi:phenylpropionate dioxygenase-like ring-hydroxylating dioxygenase large terminal subunit